MMDVVVMLLIITAAVFAIASIITIGEYSCNRSECQAKIGFDHFKAMYQINRYGWTLNDNYVGYSPRGSWSYTYFCFSIRDTIRYHRWKARYDKLKEQKDRNDLLRPIYEEWQSRIDEYAAALKMEQEAEQKAVMEKIDTLMQPRTLEFGEYRRTN